ncbi:MAG: hypothetical protein VR72_02985 [Clostridiaceae bacterium BRH_c20a]|nr:MAG: hypothetical protein VR72_02985 [Clostridiaceae bacterium BRH_c20a]
MLPVNTTLKILESAARTATATSADLDNRFAKGVLITLDVTAAADTPSIVLSVEVKDEVSGKHETIFTASAAVTGVGTHSYLIYPGAAAAADDIAQVAGFPLPKTWRVKVTHADEDSITYSVGGNLII